MTRAIVALLTLATLLVGCLSYGPATVQGDSVVAVSYVHDAEHAVGCWVFVGGRSGTAMTCLPDSQYRVTP